MAIALESPAEAGRVHGSAACCALQAASIGSGATPAEGTIEADPSPPGGQALRRYPECLPYPDREEQEMQMNHSLGALVLGLAGSLAAQTTWVVPNNANLTPYIAQASPGDTLLLSNQHTGFVLDKGLTLRPLAGRSQISLDPTGPSPQASTTSVLTPAGQRSLLVDIDFRLTLPWMQGMIGGVGHPVTATGTTSFQGCTFQSLGEQSPALTSNGDVTLRHCSTTTSYGAIGMIVAGGTCSAVRCQFTGANSTSNSVYGYLATPGVLVSAGRFVASQCTMTPGVATLHPMIGAPLGPTSGLIVDGGSAHVTDGTIRGGAFPSGAPSTPGPYDGAPAISVPSGSVTYARCTLLPGNGALGAPPPAPTLGNASVDAQLVGIDSSGSLVRGTTWTATARAGASGQLLGFGLSFGLSPSTLPLVPEPLWMDPATAILVNFSTPAAGATVPAAFPIPNVASLVGSELWCQALQLDASLVRVSPLVGGVIR
ncbi:MAG: hypothetical protein MUC36_09790 [Planctomycetes bacterium]|nr:hypothetical protein [Planctomycetota bacterium]